MFQKLHYPGSLSNNTQHNLVRVSNTKRRLVEEGMLLVN